MKFARPKSNAHVRRKGRLHRYRKPSARRERSDAVSGSRSSWNGVRIKRSDTVENAYESASTTNGNARARPNSAPPSGGPPSRTAACRPVCAAAAAGSCRVGTTDRNAPAYAAEKSAAPAPSMNAAMAIPQRGV